MSAVQQLALAVDRAARRVDVLRATSGTKLPRTEPEDTTAHVADGEHQAATEPILQGASPARSPHEPDLAQLLRREPCRLRRAKQRVPFGRGEPDGEVLACRLVDPAGGEVFGGLRGLRRSRAAQMCGVERGCAIKRDEFARTTRAPRLDAGVLVLALKLDPGAAGEELERGGEVEPFLELGQAQHVSAGVAAEALEQLLARRDGERGGALVVKRTEADHPVVAGPPQLGVLTCELDEVGGVAYALLGFLGEARQSPTPEGTAIGICVSDSRARHQHHVGASCRMTPHGRQRLSRRAACRIRPTNPFRPTMRRSYGPAQIANTCKVFGAPATGCARRCADMGRTLSSGQRGSWRVAVVVGDAVRDAGGGRAARALQAESKIGCACGGGQAVCGAVSRVTVWPRRSSWRIRRRR